MKTDQNISPPNPSLERSLFLISHMAKAAGKTMEAPVALATIEQLCREARIHLAKLRDDDKG